MSKLKRKIEELEERIEREQEQNFDFYCQRDYLMRTNFIGNLTNEKLIEEYKEMDEQEQMLRFNLLKETFEETFEEQKKIIEQCSEKRASLIVDVNSMYARLKEFEEKQEILDKYKKEEPKGTAVSFTTLTTMPCCKKEKKETKKKATIKQEKM